MEKTNKIKLFIGLFYITILFLFLYFLFSKFSLSEISSYEFIKNNRNYLNELKKNNLIYLSFIFLIFSAVWVFMAGFLSPLALFSGFIFGKWLGTILIVFGTAIGATSLYVLANYFFKDIVKAKFLNKFENLELKFKKSEFYYLLLYRFIGGIPFAISNIIPCMFNVRPFNFFFATLIGILPQIFIIVSIGDGLENLIEQNEKVPKILDFIYNPDIYVPLIFFFVILLLTIFLKKIFYKK